MRSAFASAVWFVIEVLQQHDYACGIHDIMHILVTVKKAIDRDMVIMNI